MKKEYLGDGVYAHFNGQDFKLTTEDGWTATNTIHIEPAVLANLIIFISKEMPKGFSVMVEMAQKETAKS